MKQIGQDQVAVKFFIFLLVISYLNLAFAQTTTTAPTDPAAPAAAAA